MTRYLTEFRLSQPYPRGVTDWITPERPVAASMDEVAALIGEFSDQAAGLVYVPADKGGTIRVTQISDEVPCRDVTEDALLHFARGEFERTEEWPWWLGEMKPAYLKDDAA